jgi:hypothetical protein
MYYMYLYYALQAHFEPAFDHAYYIHFRCEWLMGQVHKGRGREVF